ncbi:MAG: glycosyltransferase [Nitrospinae bacterium]|nr:glycosyltransferase [Nitrospinota bacterium]MBF0633181.1 glycosyltransferase [Nitrospinota bacterium]
MKVSVIIPVKGKPEITRDCIESLIRFDSSILAETLIVDNSDGDETALLLAEMSWKKARRVIGSPSFNFSRSCNIGAGEANSGLLLFLNNDIVVSEGWLEALCQTVIDKGGAAGSTLINRDGTVQQAGMRFGAWGLMYRAGAGAGGDDRRFFRTTLEWAVMAAAVCISKETFDRIGGFDERYYFGIEDTDLGLKVIESGCKVRNVGASRLVHMESATLKENKPALAAHVNNIEIFNARWGGLVNRLTERYIAGLKSTGAKTVAIFGTGSAAEALRRKLESGGVSVGKFITFDTEAPSIVHGLKVEGVSPESVRDVDRVIVGAQYVTMIEDRLVKAGLGGLVYGCDLNDESWTAGTEG